MPPLTLVSHALCPYVQRAAIALDEKSVAYTRREVDLADRPAWFRQLSPLGKVPLLQVGSAVIFESAVILEYLEDTRQPALHPGDALVRAQHRAWIEFASAILADIWRFYTAPDEDGLEARRRDVAARLGWLERHLGAGPYFAGDRLHLVDTAYGPVFRYFDVFERIGDFGFFDALPRVMHYRRALVLRPSVAAAVAPDYPARLWDFLLAREGALSRRMRAAPAGEAVHAAG